MKIKFSRMERVAGLFVLCAIALGMGTLGALAIRQGWFESKVSYWTDLPSAQGISPGTEIQMSGLRIGAVGGIFLMEEGRVRLELRVSERYAGQIRSGAVVQSWRPFLIGARVLEMTRGEGNLLPPGSELPHSSSSDLLEMVSGRQTGPTLVALSGALENMRKLAEAFSDPKRTTAMIEIFDDLRPLVRNATVLTGEITKVVKPLNKDRRLEIAADNIVELTVQLKHALPALTEVMKDSPRLAKELTGALSQLAALSNELSKAIPMVSELAPEIPKTGRRAVEALDETVIVLKALQKSFLMRGNVKEVREEEAKRARQPASEAPK